MVNIGTTRILADAAFSSGNYVKAHGLYETIVQHDNNNADVWVLIGGCLIMSLASNPLNSDFQRDCDSTIKVSFQHFTRAIDCLLFYESNAGERTNLSQGTLNNVTTRERQAIFFMINSIEKLRSQAQLEVKAEQENYNIAAEYKKWANGIRFTSKISNDNNSFNSSFKGASAANHDAMSLDFYQKSQMHYHKKEAINNVIDTLKSATRDFVNNLKGSFSDDELEEFDWHLLSPDEKNEKAKKIEQDRREQIRLEENTLISDFFYNNPDSGASYLSDMQEAKNLFKNRKYKLAIVAAISANQHYQKALKYAGKERALEFNHTEPVLSEIVNQSRKKITERQTLIVSLIVLFCVALSLYFFYFKK